MRLNNWLNTVRSRLTKVSGASRQQFTRQYKVPLKLTDAGMEMDVPPAVFEMLNLQ